MNDEHDALAARLGERLREEADAFVPGPPPVLTVLRQGRRMRRRRRLAVTTAFAAALLLPWAATTLPELTRGPTTAQANTVTRDTARVVRPYEGVEIGPGLGLSIALRGPDRPGSEDGESYVLSGAAGIAAAVKNLAADERPRVSGDGSGNDLSGFLTVTREATVISGTWRTKTGAPPRSITVTLDGQTQSAKLLRLADTPGWGVYYAVFGVGAGASPVPDPSLSVVRMPRELLIAMLDGNGRIVTRISELGVDPRIPTVVSGGP